MKRPPGYEMLTRVRQLRREMTPQERILRGHLRDRHLNGAKFRKQMWLDGYVVDFACPAARLVVEADGSQHADNAEYDSKRSAAFARLGWRTLRFWNNEITENLEGVLIVIANALPPPSHPASRAAFPLPCREREEDPLSVQGREAGAKCQGEGL